MLTVHHLRISQSERIVWLCEELGIEYDLKLYNRREDNRLAPDDYKALHPMGIAPVVTYGDFVLGESGAIIDWIIAMHGAQPQDGGAALVPPVDSPDFADHLFWFHWANATFMTTQMMGLALGMAGVPEAASQGFVGDRMRKGWALVEARLGEAPFFGGQNLSTADIMLGFNLTTGRMFGEMSLEPFPNLRGWLQRIGQRPAYQRAMAKAEPGMPPKLD